MGKEIVAAAPKLRVASATACGSKERASRGLFEAENGVELASAATQASWYRS
jgi:hypothetical protein